MKVLLGGDFCPINRAEKLLREGKSIFSDDLHEKINAVDYLIANLECPITKHTRGIEKAGPHLKASPEIYNGLSNLGLYALAMANNHIMDFGYHGLKESCEILEQSGIAHFGTMIHGRGSNVIVLEDKSTKTAVLTYSNQEFSLYQDFGGNGAFPIDVINIIKDIEHYKKECDHVIVLLHTGLFNFPLPSPAQKKLCRFLINRGVSAVLCQHSHICGAYEYFEEGFISYGQGSFVFDMQKTGTNWEHGYLVELDLNEFSMKAILSGVNQFGEKPIVRLLSGQEEEKMRKELTPYNLALVDEEKYQIYWKAYLKSKSKDYFGNILLPYNKWTRRFTRRYNFGEIIPHQMKVVWLNLFRNTEHSEVIKEILSEYLNEK